MKDLTGLQFGELIVISYKGTESHNRVLWECLCSCGVSAIITSRRLMGGLSVSCGCRKPNKRPRTKIHGELSTHLYTSWCNILKYAKKVKRSTPPEWRSPTGKSKLNQGFPVFKAYFVSKYPNIEELLSSGYTIERIDYTGHYYPENLEVVVEYTKSICHPEKEHKGRGLCSTCYGMALRYRKYGLTLEDYDKLLYLQGFKCAVCTKKLPTELSNQSLDHDHKTNKARGILCTGCNTGLGKLGDSIEGLDLAKNYLLYPPANVLYASKSEDYKVPKFTFYERGKVMRQILGEE